MSKKKRRPVRRRFIPPPVESLSALDFLWEDELLKETKEKVGKRKKQENSGGATA